MTLRIFALVGLLFLGAPVGAQSLEEARFLTAVTAWLTLCAKLADG